MNLRGNTIFITGGGSGIGRALAEELHARGNTVIIGGRRMSKLQEVVTDNPGIEAIDFDLADPKSIEQACAWLLERHPTLDVLINNAGVMMADRADRPLDDEDLLAQVSTNLLGPMRMSSALIEHLKRQPRATIVYTSSSLAAAPLAVAAVYSATKAALSSYAASQRIMLKGTSVSVREIIPNFVATSLAGAPDPRAMSLDAFVEEAVDALLKGAEEVRVDPVEGFLAKVANQTPLRSWRTCALTTRRYA